ncbi:MAG: C40 family peptidase [Sulfuricella sp.]|nr:C40 family peptidase [Sulfuricella sp.]
MRTLPPKLFFLLGLTLGLAACSSTPPREAVPSQAASLPPAPTLPSQPPAEHPGKEVVMYALGLMEIDYRFGGKNPEQGLDCSGMVRYIYRNAAGLDLPHNASKMAGIGKAIEPASLAPGDLVFFNTTGKRFSHVGIYLGDARFIHAPSTNGKIKISSFKTGYYAKRLEAARTLFN